MRRLVTIPFVVLAFTLGITDRGNCGTRDSVPESSPNIIVIFTDDQGYNDLGCFGSPNIKTPHIDRLAEEGMRFTSFYSGASVCTPSRAALLTGCYPERVGNLPVLFPHTDRGLNPQETTIAEMLQEQGYATACIGKWHLGHQPASLPTEHGFDEYFGVPYSNDMGVDPSMPLAPDVVFREGKSIRDFQTQSAKLPPLFENKLVVEWPADQRTLTKRYTEHALDFIDRHQDRPFFIYLPHTMPHIPLYASDDFRGKSEAGLYGDTLEEIDWSLGQILAQLERLALDNQTLIIYTSDNGPWDLKGNETDKVKGNMNRRIGGSAYPLRGHKFSKWEGGMRVPCVMRWPSRIPKGRTCDEIAASMDLLPTIAELAGGKLPALPIDGLSIVNLLTGDESAETPHVTYFFRTVGVRSGKWKFINNQLFDLTADIAESHNLSEQFPEKTAELKSLLEAHKWRMKSEGRPPAYYERSPHPLKNAEGWTVYRGRWSKNNKNILRQQSDWTESELTSSGQQGPIAQVQVAGKLMGDQGAFSLAVIDGRTRRAELSLDAQGHATLTYGDQKHQLVVPNFAPNQWHQLRLQIIQGNLTATVDDFYLGSVVLERGLDVCYISLSTNKSKADFRNLRCLRSDGTEILQEFQTKAP